MAKESSGLVALALSAVGVALLAATPTLVELLGWSGVGVFWVLLLVGAALWRLQGQKKSATPASDIQEKAEGQSASRRKKGKKTKERDHRGLAFHNFKAHEVQCSSAGAPKKGALKRTATVDENGDLWEFKETIGVRTISIDPAAPKEEAPTSEKVEITEEPKEESKVELDSTLEGELASLLREAGLPEKLPQARQWCADMGAGFLNEVCENVSDLAESLGLNAAATARLETACSSATIRRASSKEFKSKTERKDETPGVLRRGASSLLGSMKTISVGLTKTFSKPPVLGRQVSVGYQEMERVASSLGLGAPTVSVTRATSYMHGAVTCQEVQVGVIDHEDIDEADEDSDSDDEPAPALGDKLRGKALFTRAARALVWGLRLRREYKIHAVQVSREESTPTEEESKLDGKSALAKLAEFQAPTGCECLTLIVPAGTVAIDSLQANVSGKRARKYIQLVASSLEGAANDLPKNGLAVFLKVFSKEDINNELVAIEPPVPLKQFALSDGPIFATELLAQLYKTDILGLACTVISGEEALLYRLFADHGRLEARIQPRLQKRQKKGGQSALRIARLAEEVRAAYVRIVAERMNKEFTNEDGMNVEMTVIGGSKELADNLHASDWLDYRIQKTMKRANEIKESDHLAEVLNKALALKHQKDEGSTMTALRECEAKSHTELAAYGLKDVVRRIEEYNIATLIFAVGSGISKKLEDQATSIGGAKVVRVERGLPAHEELVRKWGGAFAICRWKPQDYEEGDDS